MAADGEETPPSAGLLRECRLAHDAWARFVTSHAGIAVMVLWAGAEATFWPIIPDFLLAPMAAGARRRFPLPLLAAITGMACGGSITYVAATLAPHEVLAWLRRLPLVSDAQVRVAHQRLARRGVSAFWFQPWSGVPFKVWAVEAGSMKLSAAIAIPTFIVARSLRMTLFAALAGLLGEWFPRFIRDFFLFLALIYVVLFLFGWWQVMRMS